MDLRAMVVVTATIAAERLAPAGARVARAVGFLMVGAGLFLMVKGGWLTFGTHGVSSMPTSDRIARGLIERPCDQAALRHVDSV
jgi:hypothetical protein